MFPPLKAISSSSRTRRNKVAKLNWKGGALLAPVPPVMVSCGSMEKPNIITIGWTGILNTQPPKTYISVRPSRHSYGLIQESGTFVINLTTVDMVRTVDYCGVKSGKDTDKFGDSKLTAIPSPNLGCPMIAECPVSLECKVIQVIPLGTHDMFLADIIGVTVEDTLVSSQGRLELDKAKLLAYAHGEYYALGEKLGSFGYSVRKKPLSNQSKGRAVQKTAKKSVSKQTEKSAGKPKRKGEHNGSKNTKRRD